MNFYFCFCDGGHVPEQSLSNDDDGGDDVAKTLLPRECQHLKTPTLPWNLGGTGVRGQRSRTPGGGTPIREVSTDPCPSTRVDLDGCLWEGWGWGYPLSLPPQPLWPVSQVETTGTDVPEHNRLKARDRESRDNIFSVVTVDVREKES